MALPTFEGFSLQDTNFITERIFFRGYADRAITRAKLNRREGIKLLGEEFGEKEIEISGVVIASSAAALQTLLDNMKNAFRTEEGDLVIEQGRAYRATVSSLEIPDEHYNQSKTDFRATFICSDPFAEGDQLSVTQPVTSGLVNFSGMVNISGSFFVRPTVTYNPPSNTGPTFITLLALNHINSGQTVTVSGFGSGTPQGLGYQNSLTINLDDFTSFEGTTQIDNSGAFPVFEPGVNNYTVTASGRRFPGGSVTLTYKPRYS